MSKLELIQKAARSVVYASSVALFAGAGLASANVDIISNNGTTGPFSYNDSTFNANSNLDVSVENYQDVSHDFEVYVDAGNNEIANNTTVASLDGGDIDVSISANTGLGLLDGIVLPFVASQDVTGSASNDTTGPNSENINTINANQDVAIDVENYSTIDNYACFDVNTGNNSVTSNTTVGDVSTGDTTISADFNNNTSDGSLLDLGGLIGSNNVSADFSNSVTGPNSENINTLNADNTVNLDVYNESTVTNDFSFDVNSGNNDITDNTTVGNVSTGDISISISSNNL